MTIKVLVPISGGKDSQACLKLATQRFPLAQIRGLFCDTQFEHPDTYQHVRKLSALYGVEIITVCDGDVLSESVRYKRFPGGGARHCTDKLKIRPTRMYCKWLAEQQGGFEVWYGMRTEESPDRARRYETKISDELYRPHEVMPSKYPQYLGKMGVRFRLPILDWRESDVHALIAPHAHPHYALGFGRVGCFPCLAGGDFSKERAFEFDAFGAYQLARTQRVAIQIHKSIWTSKGGKERNEGNGCLVCSY